MATFACIRACGLTVCFVVAMACQAQSPGLSQSENNAAAGRAGSTPSFPPMPDGPEDLLTVGSQVNGLTGPGVKPWHIRANYQEFGPKGEVVTTGTFEELWYSDRKYKRTFSFKHYNVKFDQTDIATAKGLFRVGDQDWPGQREESVQNALIQPILLQPNLSQFKLQKSTRVLGGQDLVCVDNGLRRGGDPDYLLQGALLTESFCFEQKRPELRLELLPGDWGGVVFNDVVLFQGHSVAREVETDTRTGVDQKIDVEILEQLPDDTTDFTVPPEAKGPFIEPIPISFGWMTRFLVKTTFLSYKQDFLNSGPVAVSFTIGRDGAVTSAHGMRGSKKLQDAWSKAILQWQYRPFLLMGKAVEVQTTLSSGGPPVIMTIPITPTEVH